MASGCFWPVACDLFCVTIMSARWHTIVIFTSESAEVNSESSAMVTDVVL